MEIQGVRKSGYGRGNAVRALPNLYKVLVWVLDEGSRKSWGYLDGFANAIQPNILVDVATCQKLGLPVWVGADAAVSLDKLGTLIVLWFEMETILVTKKQYTSSRPWSTLNRSQLSTSRKVYLMSLAPFLDPSKCVKCLYGYRFVLTCVHLDQSMCNARTGSEIIHERARVSLPIFGKLMPMQDCRHLIVSP